MSEWVDIQIPKIFESPSTSEVLVNDWNRSFIERKGVILPIDLFESEEQFRLFLQNLLRDINKDLSRCHPYISSQWKKWRVQIVGPPVSLSPLLSFRQTVFEDVRLSDLVAKDSADYEILRKISQSIGNTVIVGPTGSGKTTLLSAMLRENKNRRYLIIEDVPEIKVPNPLSARLLTENHEEAIRHSMRLRPESLVLGEVRGKEAKDFLMTLSSGHGGSLFSIHARNSKEALLRLEMLIQMGAPDWSLDSIRRLLQLTIGNIISLSLSNGDRKIQSIERISSLESHGFLLEKLGSEFVL